MSIITEYQNTPIIASAEQLTCKIKWVHGTNSSLLSMLPFTDYKILPSGNLLSKGIAPMCGEIDGGGMCLTGVNQTTLSACRIKQIDKSWGYASRTSKTFESSANFAWSFKKNLDLLGYLSPEIPSWNPLLVHLLRLKQWDPERFERLCLEHVELIEEIKTKTWYQSPCQKILRALDYPTKELLKAEHDLDIRAQIDDLFLQNDGAFPHQHWALKREGSYRDECRRALCDDNSFFDASGVIKAIFRLRLYPELELADLRKYIASVKTHKEYKEIAKVILGKDTQGNLFSAEDIIQKLIREKVNANIQKIYIPEHEKMLRIFDHKPPIASFGKAERDMLQLQFPLLLASTKVKPIKDLGLECTILPASIGKDVDLFFVNPTDIPQAEEWLKTHNLETLVTVYPSTMISEIQKVSKTTQSLWEKFSCCIS